MDERTRLLSDWAKTITQAAQAGGFGGKAIGLHSIETIKGPRAGALLIHAGLDSGKLLRNLASDDSALLRQFVTWEFTGEPIAFMAGRYVRVEAGWPAYLSETKITLADVGGNPKNGGRWIAGKNEAGATLTVGFSDNSPHFLVGGQTGSGKTVAMTSAIAQLSRDKDNQIVLIDAKYGAGFSALAGLPGLVGPVAVDVESAKGALSWAVTEMRRRYETGGAESRLIVAIDEVQELSQDTQAVEFLRRLVAQGRGAGVHCLIGTQHPVMGVFGDSTIRRNLTGRLALRTEDYKSSEVVVGAPNPRADKLLGAGDCYALVPGAVHRAQIAFIPDQELKRMNTARPALDDWPDVDSQAVGSLPDGNISPIELACALVNAQSGGGRPALAKMIEAETGSKPGAEKGIKILKAGREVYKALVGLGWHLCDEE